MQLVSVGLSVGPWTYDGAIELSNKMLPIASMTSGNDFRVDLMFFDTKDSNLTLVVADISLVSTRGSLTTDSVASMQEMQEVGTGVAMRTC